MGLTKGQHWVLESGPESTGPGLSDLIRRGDPTGRWGTFGSLSERCGWIVKVILPFLCFPLCCLSRANGQSWGFMKHRNSKGPMGREDRRVRLQKLPVFLIHFLIFGGDLRSHHAGCCRLWFKTHSSNVFLFLTTSRFATVGRWHHHPHHSHVPQLHYRLRRRLHNALVRDTFFSA